jgi:plastocyanin
MKPITIGLVAALSAIALSPVVALAGEIQGKVTCKGLRDNRDAVVYVETVEGKFDPPQKVPEMDQLKMKFIPHVLPIVLGTTVNFLNSDEVLHNIFTPSKEGDRFNLGSWPKGEIKSYTFKKMGQVRLLCNVHPEMLAWIVVLQNPYFATTGPDGTYSIPDVPAGSYTLKVWHEKLKPASEEVTVPASGAVQKSFTIAR